MAEQNDPKGRTRAASISQEKARGEPQGLLPAARYLVDPAQSCRVSVQPTLGNVKEPSPSRSHLPLMAKACVRPQRDGSIGAEASGRPAHPTGSR